MRWTCPRGHDGPLADSLTAVRELVASMALTHFCPNCQTSYLLKPEVQHRVLQCLEERGLAAWLNGDTITAGCRQWRFRLTRLRLIARFPPDLAEVEALADAGDDAPRVRVVVRLDVGALRSPELLRRKLKHHLEQRFERPTSA